MYRNIIGLFVALACLGWVNGANAQAAGHSAETMAGELAKDGTVAYAKGDWATAMDRFDRAYAMHPRPTIGLYYGKTLTQQGKLLEAAEQFRVMARQDLSTFAQPELERQALAEAARELLLIEPRVPSLTVRFDGTRPEGVLILIDGKANLADDVVGQPQRLNPGVHQVVALRGDRKWEAQVKLEETRFEFVTVKLPAPDPLPPPSAQPAPGTPTRNPPLLERTNQNDGWPAGAIVGTVMLSVGALGLVTGATTGALAMNKKSDLDKNPNCLDNRCLYSVSRDVDTYNHLRTASTIGFLAGGALALTGLVLVLTSRNTSEHVALQIGPTTAVMMGSF